MLSMGAIISLLDPFDALAVAPASLRPRRSASLSSEGEGEEQADEQQVVYLEQAAGQSLAAAAGRQQASGSRHAQQAQNESVASGGAGEQQRAAAAAALAQRREQREQHKHKQPQPQQQQQQKNKERAATMRAATAKKTKTKTTTHQQPASRQVDASKRESRSSLPLAHDTSNQSPVAPVKHWPASDHFKRPSLSGAEQATQSSGVEAGRKTMTMLANKHRVLGPVASSPPSAATNAYHQQVAHQRHFHSNQHHHHRRSFQGSCIVQSRVSGNQNQQKMHQKQQVNGHQQRSPGPANGPAGNMLQQISSTYHKSQFHKNNNSNKSTTTTTTTAPRHYQHNHNHSSASSTISSSDDSSGLPESGPPTPDHEDAPRPPPLPTKQMMQFLCSKAATELMAFTSTGEIELPAAHLAWWQWCRNLGTQPANDHPSVHPVPPPRRWLHCSKGQPKHQQHGQFTVLSYNVLANRLVNSKVFPSSPQMALNWFYRRELILRQLVEFDADVVALQEVEQQHFDSFFKPHMESRGYGCLFGPKSRFKTMEAHKRSSVDGCAIFYKLNKFSLVQQHLLEYNQIAMANAKGSEAMLNRVMTKDNIGLAAILEMKSYTHTMEPPQQLLVCNTHIHWDPEYCDVKLIQTIMLMNELECIAKHHTRGKSTSPTQLFGGDDALNGTTTMNDLMPLVLLGDFNSMPNSGVTTYLTGGKIDSLHEDFKNEKYTSCSNALAIRTAQPPEQHDGLAARRQSSPAWCFYHEQPPSPTTSTASSASSHPTSSSSTTTTTSSSPSFRSSLSMDADKEILNYQHEFKLASAYDEHLMPYTNYTCNFKAMIDYIFYSQHSLELVGLLGPFDKDWFRKSGIQGLPQAHLPSDHLPLLAKLSLVGRKSQSINHQNQS